MDLRCREPSSRSAGPTNASCALALLAAGVALAFGGGCHGAGSCADYCACDCFSGCSGDTHVTMGLRETTDDNGCPCCECFVVSTHVCTEGCIDFGWHHDPICAEDIPDTCGNGVLDPHESCDPGMAVAECTKSECPVPGVWQECYADCTTWWGGTCEFPPEVCGNGIDEDCDGRTDDGCP